MTARLHLSDLRNAFEWVSTVGPFENQAYVSRATGQVWLVSDFDDSGEEAPENAGDEALYLTVPSKNELDLGRSLALDFAAEHLPERAAEITSLFARPGAFGKFKSVLEAEGKLASWYACESKGIDQALRAWAAQNGIALAEDAP